MARYVDRPGSDGKRGAPARGQRPAAQVPRLAGWALLFVVLGCRAEAPPSPLPLPPRMLWAWERPEDFTFLSRRDPGTPEVGVAYLQATLLLRRGALEVRRRQAALRIPPPVVRLPVVRIEAAFDCRLDEGLQREVRDALLAEAQAAGLGRLQIDFEALSSQRPFYRSLLAALRQQLPTGFGLSMTALASWCLGDRWLSALPVDEIVPMFYRLGRAGPELRRELARGRDLARECRAAHGLITDEPMVPPPTARRLYLFSPTTWRESALDAALARLDASKE